MKVNTVAKMYKKIGKYSTLSIYDAGEFLHIIDVGHENDFVSEMNALLKINKNRMVHGVEK